VQRFGARPPGYALHNRQSGHPRPIPPLGRSKAVSAGLGGLPTAGRADGSNSHNVSHCRYVYVGLSIASGYCYAPTWHRTASSPGPQVSGRVENRGSLHPLYAIAGQAVRAFGWKTGSTTGTLPSALIAAPGESRHGGAVLCKRSCRDLRVTRSIIAKSSIPARDPLWHAQKRSLRVSAALGRPFVPVD
jgi:hypothetical protein